MPASKCKNFRQKYQTGKNIKENGYHIITTNELEIILNYIFGVDVIGFTSRYKKFTLTFLGELQTTQFLSLFT